MFGFTKRAARLGSLSVLLVVILAFATSSRQAAADANETAVGATNSAAQASLALGSYHSCAIFDTGEVKCWGGNPNGQLGDGTFVSDVNKRFPTVVSGLTGVTALTAGYYHTCALTNTGTVKCWGSNSSGQLGDGTTIDKSSPTDVLSSIGGSALTGVTALSTSAYIVCALLNDGTVKCWGYNYSGELGRGTTSLYESIPSAVSGLSGITTISMGNYHTCALTNTGTVKCWGQNLTRQLGDGTTTSRSTPIDVLTSSGGSALTGVTALTAGTYHNCVLLSAGGRKCWGQNSSGQLGDGTTTGRSTPVDVSSLSSSASTTVATTAAPVPAVAPTQSEDSTTTTTGVLATTSSTATPTSIASGLVGDPSVQELLPSTGGSINPYLAIGMLLSSGGLIMLTRRRIGQK